MFFILFQLTFINMLSNIFQHGTVLGLVNYNSPGHTVTVHYV